MRGAVHAENYYYSSDAVGVCPWQHLAEPLELDGNLFFPMFTKCTKEFPDKVIGVRMLLFETRSPIKDCDYVGLVW